MAASRNRPDKDWQEVFWSEKDAQPSWYHNGVWKLPTLSNEQVAELADGNDFIFLTWSSYKGVLAVCLLPLIPDQSILLPQVILQVCVFCDFCSRLFHLRVLTFQTACKAEATQQHVDSYVSRPLHAS